jgi:hypothetical protein
MATRNLDYQANPYYLRPTETQDQYRTRVAQFQTPTSASGGAPTPGITLSRGTATPSAPQAGNLGSAIRDLMARHQQLGTRAFAEQGLNAEAEQYRRLGAPTSPDLVGASPGTQSSVRGASVSALQPTISGAAEGQQTFSEQIAGFKNIVDEFNQGQERLKSQARADLEFIIETGGADGLEAVLREQPDAFKMAGFDAKTIEGMIPAIRARELASLSGAGTRSTQVVDLGNGRKVLIDTQTGETISDLTGSAAQGQQQSETSRGAVSLIDQLLDRNTEAIAGLPNISLYFPGTDAQRTANLAKQLGGLMTLENRTLLKGSGAISDYEARTLDRASSALGIDPETGRTNLSNEDFIAELNKLKMELGGTIRTDDGLEWRLTPDGNYEQVSFSSGANRPQRNNNPGNLKAGSQADRLAIGVDEQNHLIFPSAEVGMRALRDDIDAKISGRSRWGQPRTIAELNAIYAEDPNWKNNVARLAGVSVTTPLSAIPRDRLISAIMGAEGYNA